MCVLLLIEEVLADQTTCFVAALEVSILAEKSNAFGVTEIEQFSTLGLLSKAIEWKTGESGGDAAKESNKNTSWASCLKDVWNEADVLKSTDDVVQTSLCFFRFWLLANTFPHGSQINDLFFWQKGPLDNNSFDESWNGLNTGIFFYNNHTYKDL